MPIHGRPSQTVEEAAAGGLVKGSDFCSGGIRYDAPCRPHTLHPRTVLRAARLSKVW